MSSSEEDSGTESFQRKRRRKQHNEAFDSSPSSNSTGSPVIKNKHRVRGQASSARNVIEDSYESESDSSIEVQRRRKVQKVISDEEDSSGSDIVKTSRKTPNVISESEIDSSDWETDSEAEDAKQNAADPSAVDFDSDFSDGQSEKCPICLLSIRTQELGTPESCDHIFCVECIQEWSKNMNTCPVDRQEYNLILVRKKIGGKIIRQIPIEKPQNEVEIVEDPTFCEVCGSSEGEDRMLLCDGCDLGFHLQCLTPPLEEVPAGAWFCADCSPEDVVNQEIDFFEVQFLLDDAEADIEMTNGRRRHFSPRLIPRTRQSERVRTRIVTNRQNRSTANMDQPATSSNAASNAERSTVSSTTRKKPLKKKATKKKTKRSRKTKTRKRYTVRYEVDPVTGETIEIVKVKRRRTKKKKTRKQRPAAVPKTVKKRLALQLGICNPKQPSQLLPDVRISNAGNKINNQRWNAGIPTLHIYGNRDSLEYFSGSDDEELGDSGLGLLTRRRAPTHSDLVAFRRMERRKGIHISSTTPAVSSSTDLLDSILDAQTKLYAKNTILEIGQGGAIKMKMDENKKDAKLNNNINNLVRKAPGYQNNSSNRPNNFCTSSNSVQSNNSYGGGSVPNYAPTSTTTSSSAYQGGDDEQSAPQDYTHQNLCSLETSLMDPESNAQKSDSEVDIYSDIESETVSTSKAGNEPKLPENEEYDPELAEIGREGSEDDNDSESNMVIDTEKVEPPLDEYDDDASQEEATVSSSIDTRNAVNSPVANYTAPSILHSTYDDKNMRFDEDDFDLDGCPNFCIYSSESMNMAKHTDVTGNNSAVQNDQVEEITSTPVDAESLMPDDRPFEEHEHPEECTSTPVEPEESTVKEQTPLEISSTPLDAENVSKDTTCEAEEQVVNVVMPDEDEDITSNENQSQEPEATDQEARNVITNADVSVEQEPEERALTPPLDAGEPNKKQDKEPKTPEIIPVVSSKILDNNKSKKTALDSVGLYSDSDDEAVVNKKQTSFTDICNMTEDISEEERSYTPCLDENVPKQGLDGLDTEMISDEEKNDFEESQERDGDALEINAKESELDLARPEDFEDGEIFEMFKSAAESILKESYEDEGVEAVAIDLEKLPDKKVTKEVRKESKKTNKEAKKSNKENTKDNKENKKEDKEPTKEKEPKKDSNANTSTDSSFKKLSRSNKDRNYRDKENKTRQRARSNSRENENKENKKRKKRKEIERYDVRALMADKPRRTTDKFGRDVRDSASKSKSKSPPRTPPPRDRTPSPITRRSLSKNRNRSPSLTRRSPSIRRSLTPLRNRSPSPARLRNRSPSITPPRRRSPSPNASRRTPPRQRRRSLSRKHRSPSPVKARKRGNRSKVARSVSRSPVRKRSGKRRRSPTPEKRRKNSIKKTKSGKKRIGSRRRSRSPTPTGRLRVPQWSRRDPRDSPTHSTSRSPGPRNPSPSWTPPRLLDTVNPHNLTVILANDQLKKKALRKKKEKRLKDAIDKASKKRRKNRPSPPAKEVYASGDNILVSVSYNKENETRAVTTRDVISTSNRRQEDEPPPKKKRKEKAKRPKEGKRKKKNTLDLTNVKPVAIIDLDLSPFKEITPSPKDVIVLSDSENERETIEQRVLQQEICDSSQVPSSPERIDAIYTTGPKTPPEPQIKFALPSNKPQLRTVNPLIDPAEIELELLEAQNATNDDERLPDSVHIGPNTPPDPPNSAPSSPDAYDPFEPTKSRSPSVEPLESAQILEEASAIETSKEKSVVVNETLSLTPPMAEVQPADSQSSIHATPESSTPSKSPGEHPIGVIINQQVQSAKPIAQTTPFSSTASLVTSTPVSASAASRINILNSTILSVAATIPQRIVLPNIIKSSPIKISPVKSTTLKSSPIKPMPAKPKLSLTPRKSRTDKESETNIDLDSPYSPGSSDYEDLFEPPSEIVTKPNLSKVTTSATKPSAKVQSAFDTLFGTPFKNLKKSYDKTTSAKAGKVSTPIKIKGGTKTVGVKLDEDHLKILDELPNSAVEMQVKDKFLKKLNRQERVVEEVKLVLKPHYNKKHVTKEEYKDILRKAVPKICHNKSGEINPTKIKHLVEAYVKKIKHSKKVTSSSSVNQKS